MRKGLKLRYWPSLVEEDVCEENVIEKEGVQTDPSHLHGVRDGVPLTQDLRQVLVHQVSPFHHFALLSFYHITISPFNKFPI